MAEEQQEQQNEAADFEKVTSFIRDQVQSYMKEFTPQQQQSQQQPYDHQQQQQHRLIAETIGPVVGPALNQAITNTSAVQDEVRFYRDNPDALEHSESIERLFGELIQQGRGIPRKDLYDAILGREFRADPEKFVEKQNTRKKAQVERAEMSTDFGAAMMNKAKNDSKWGNFENLPLEEMEKALEGITF
jgi:hypothetical protein